MKAKNLIFITNWVKKTFNKFLDFLLPEKCIKCGKSGELICDICIYQLPQNKDNPSDKIFSAFNYQDEVVKKILINLKYFNKKSFGNKLGKILYNRMLEEIADIKSFSDKKILLVPIPMTRKRLKERGYNQALLIAHGIASCDEKTFDVRNNILIKMKDTTRQAKIKNREERLKNLKGSFFCKKDETMKGHTIILVDDITTTGATINEAMRALKHAGVKKVFGFVIAH